MRTRRLVGVAGALVVGLLVAGCGGTQPGTASVVNGTTITRDQVEKLSSAQCSGVELASKQGQGQAVSRKQLSQRALGLLIDIQLNLDFGKSLSLTPRPEQVAADFAQVKPLIAALPEKYRDYLSDVFHDWAEGRDMVEQVGEEATGQQASTANSDQVLEAGYQKREAWLKKDATIKTDPRYGPGKTGWPGEGDPSVSTPVSSYAKSASAAQPSQGFVADLPAGQRCG